MIARSAENRKVPRREFDRELDALETKITELRLLYEQFFIQLIPLAPEKEHKELKFLIRKLLKAPFKNSQTRYRLRQIIQRYQTYNTYWERVLKQRDEGKYSKDLFKAEIHEKEKVEEALGSTVQGKAAKGVEQLFTSYKSALEKAGSSTDKLNFDAFRKSIAKRAKELKKEHGDKKIKYKVVVKNGKVVLKASIK